MFLLPASFAGEMGEVLRRQIIRSFRSPCCALVCFLSPYSSACCLCTVGGTKTVFHCGRKFSSCPSLSLFFSGQGDFCALMFVFCPVLSCPALPYPALTSLHVASFRPCRTPPPQRFISRFVPGCTSTCSCPFHVMSCRRFCRSWSRFGRARTSCPTERLRRKSPSSATET